jgi:hypothetical protein
MSTFIEKIQEALAVDYEALAAKVGPIPVPAIDAEGAAKIVRTLIWAASQCYAGKGRGYPLYWLRSPHVTAGLPEKLVRLIKLTLDIIAETLAGLPPTHPNNSLFTPLEKAMKAADPVFKIGFETSAFGHPFYTTIWNAAAEQINAAYELVAQKRGTPAAIQDWRYGPSSDIHALSRGHSSDFEHVISTAIRLARAEKELIDLAVRWKLVVTSPDHNYDAITIQEVLDARQARIDYAWQAWDRMSWSEQRKRRNYRKPGEKQIDDALEAYHAARGQYDAALKEIAGVESKVYDPINSPEFVLYWQQYRTVIGYLQGRAARLDADAAKAKATAERKAARLAKQAEKVRELDPVIELEPQREIKGERLNGRVLKQKLVGRPASSLLIVDAGPHPPVICFVRTLRDWLTAYLGRTGETYDIITAEIDIKGRALVLKGRSDHATYTGRIRSVYDLDELTAGPGEADSFLIGLATINA